MNIFNKLVDLVVERTPSPPAASNAQAPAVDPEEIIRRAKAASPPSVAVPPPVEQVVEKIQEHREAERQREFQPTPVAHISVISIGGSVSRAGARYRFQIRIEADNFSNCVLGWSGLTINVPTLRSRYLYETAEIQVSSIGCDPPFQYGPGDEIFGFLDDGSFGRKQATSVLIESVREHWPPHERMVLEAVLYTSCSRLDTHLRVWSNVPPAKSGEGFGDPDWKAPLQKDQQGIPAYSLSVGFNY
jgi:hypothetical protein